MFGNSCVKGMPAVCWILFLSATAGFGEPVSWPAKGFERIQEDCGTGSVEDFPLPADRPRAKELHIAAEKQGLTNALQLAKWMKKTPKFSGFFSKFTAVNYSESLQAASFESPRITAYNQGLFLGAPGHSEGLSPAEATVIELWEADESRMPPAVFYELDLSTKPPKLVENPSRCQMCHGSPPFARWDSIPFWPGTVSKDERSMGQELVNRNDPFYALFDWENYDSEGSGPYNMGRAIAPYQRMVMADRLKRDPQFDSYKYAYLGAMGFCDSIETFLPLELRRDHLRKLKKQFDLSEENMTALHDDTMSVMNEEKESRAKRYQRSVEAFQKKYGKAPEKSFRLSYQVKSAEAESVTSMRFLVEGKGISMSDWSNTNHGKSGRRSYDYGVESDMGGVRAIACLLVPEIIKEPEMSELLADRISFDDDRTFEKEHKAAICKKLREKSLAALASLTGTGPAPVENAAKNIHGATKGHAPNPK